MIQFTYWLVTCSFASYWFVSIAPFLPEGSLPHPLIPSYVWPNTTSSLQNWIYNASAAGEDPAWGFCNLSKTDVNTSFPIPTFPPTFVPTTPNFPTNSNSSSISDQLTTITAGINDFFGWEFCLTSIAVDLYLFFLSGSTLLLLYHVMLTVYWPDIEARMFPFDDEEDKAAEGPLERFVKAVSRKLSEIRGKKMEKEKRQENEVQDTVLAMTLKQVQEVELE